MDQTSTVYLYTVLVIQLLVCLLIFEFIRSPWKGALLMIEEAEEELNQRIFEEDEIGQYSFAADTSNQLGETTLIGLKNRQAVTVNDKVTAL